MNKEDLNIELIKDYFAGRLDAKAMHALEKRALEDPFLAEAMEGFHGHTDNISKGLDDLQARLENRIHKKSFTLKPWLVAASVVLLSGIGTYFIWNYPNNKTQNLAKEIVQNATVRQPVVIHNDSQNLKPGRQDSLSEILLSHNTIKAKDIDRKEHRQKILADTNNDVAIISKPANIKMLSADIVSPAQEQKSSITAALQRKVAGVAANPETQNMLAPDSGAQKTQLATLNDVVVVGYGTQKKEALTGAVAGISVTKDNPSSANIYIRGNAALNHARPLIMIDGTPDSIIAVPPQDIASVNVLKGADATALYGARGENGVLLITTKNRNANNLSFRKSKSNVALSHPQNGWDKYNDYVKTAVKNSDSIGAKGTVILSFSVLPDGHLSDFKIIKGLSEERNQQAIDILKNGSLWTYDATSHTGIYTIDF